MSNNVNKVEAAMQMLRTAVADLIADDNEVGEDVNILRWLKACDLNVKKAERMMRDTIKWRKESGVEELLEKDYHPELEKGIPFTAGGKCRDGTPVVTVEGGKVDFRGLVETYGIKEVHRYCIQNLVKYERYFVQWNKENLKNRVGPITEDCIRGFVFIIDAKNVSLRQLSSIKGLQVVTQVCMDYISYFPVLGSRVIIINCNKLAVPLINIIRPIIQGPNLAVDVHDTNVEKWEPVILKRISPDQIGTAFGGSLVLT
ncbi:unnamed protein product [Allacma fusca]|uniref:CRAL-TRIO domain-containing protein n=1 Tax=Allacma fusca TaxID=39272 RepID=A0A8J2LMB3_9HEXA|nr:unnamed protein product [Allacma fusca]